MLQIGTLKLTNSLVMAPMAGYTNLPFRLMVKKLGAGLVTTEMISAMGMVMGQKKTLSYLRSHPSEKPVAVQIFGSRPEVMARAGQMAVEAGADLVDINMGCPVKKVVKTGAGAALLRDLKRVEQIVKTVRMACSVPLTVKIRTGWSPEAPVACELARIVEESGADALTVHPRFATQGFSGLADWTWISRVKELVKIPVIGNGDVLHPRAALEMREKTGCDGVMIGRGALKNPWIFREIRGLEQGVSFTEPDLSERRSFIMEHFRFLSESAGEHKAALGMRGLMLFYTKGLRNSTRFRENITKIRDAQSLMSIVDHYLSSLEMETL
ncbi:MAG: tRNA dihydrouridine synthase DusB [Desulfobacteraceae bacterium]|nr:MAG: tRNA dihydrouridine synthase DusB [Desulfobacteraceae bacterium]